LTFETKRQRTNQENIPDNSGRSLELTAHLKSGDVEVSIFV